MEITSREIVDGQHGPNRLVIGASGAIGRLQVSTFERAVEFVLRFEGDYSDDHHDSGGETRYGISKRAYPNIDIKTLTRQQAKDIYYRDYFLRCKCNELPAQLALILFDSAVNQGPTAAIRLLQKSLNVGADGVIGPITIAAAFRASPSLVITEFIARRAYQYALHPEVARFGLGWFRRLAACHQLSQEPL